MKKIIFCLVSISSLVFSACSYTEKIRDGRTAYERKQYAKAIPMLEKELKKAKSKKDKALLAYQIGDSYIHVNKPENALPYFTEATDNQIDATYLKALAFAQKTVEDYKNAGLSFKNLGIEIGSPFEYKREIGICQTAQNWLIEAPQSGISIKNIDLNSAANEYSIVHYGQDKMAFTSDRKTATGTTPYNWTGLQFSDIFITNNDFSNIEKFDNQINTALNEGSLVFNSDASELFFSRNVGEGNSDLYCKLMTSKKENGAWSSPSVLAFCKENINYAHPCLGLNGNVLFFSSNDTEGFGGYDIFYTSRTKSGWDEPKPLPKSINTEGNEEFPFMDADTLYFSSDKHLGMGGLDIFKSWRVGKDSWTPPQNLKSPINSGADDFAYIVDASSNHAKKTGFFTSNRKGGKGLDDIYQFTQVKVTPKPKPIDSTTINKPIVYKMSLDIYVLTKIYKDPSDPNSKVLGRNPISGANVTINVGGNKKNYVVNEEGFVHIDVNDNTDYQFLASSTGFLSNNGRYTTKGIAKDPNNPIQNFETEIVLDKIFKNKEITLDNIYYDYDQWYIRDDAKPTLDQLFNILAQNPNVKIQLSSHTDCRGKDAYNLDLSQKRAQSVVDYLISKGIANERLLPVGMGETSPAVTCNCSACTEAEHQINRRTTFKIIE